MLGLNNLSSVMQLLSWSQDLSPGDLVPELRFLGLPATLCTLSRSGTRWRGVGGRTHTYCGVQLSLAGPSQKPRSWSHALVSEHKEQWSWYLGELSTHKPLLIMTLSYCKGSHWEQEPFGWRQYPVDNCYALCHLVRKLCKTVIFLTLPWLMTLEAELVTYEASWSPYGNHEPT